MNKLTSQQAAALMLAGCRELAEKLSPKATLNQVMAYLVVATHDGTPPTIGNVGEQVGMSTTTTSHSLSVLAERKRYGAVGYQLLTYHENIDNRREKLVALAPAGVKLADTIARLLCAKLTHWEKQT